MSQLNVDVATYMPPANTCVLYVVDGAYKAKNASGVISDVDAKVLPVLGVEVADIPCLIFEEDLIAANQSTIVDVSGMTVAMAAKASTAYVKEVVSRKVDKVVFLGAVETLSQAIADNKNAGDGSVAAVDAKLGDGFSADATVADKVAELEAADVTLQGNIDTKVAQTAYDTKVAELVAADEALAAGKVDKNGTDRLMTAAEGDKLATYPELYSTVKTAIDEKQTAEQVTAAIQAVIANYSTTGQVDEKIAQAAARVFKYIGTVATIESLPASDAEGLAIGHVYHVTADKGEYAWNGEVWEPLGGVIDLSAYATIAYVDAEVKKEADRAKGIEAGLRTDVDAASGAAADANAAIAVLNGSGEGSVDAKVAAEATRATGVEAGLQSAIDTLNGTDETAGSVAKQVKDAVAAEAAIARAAEKDNADAIAAETERATGVEGGFETRIKAAEDAIAALGSVDGGSIADALQTKVDATAYNDKVAELTAADTALSGRMDTAEGKITTLEGQAAALESGKADKEPVVFISSTGDVELVTNTWYVVSSEFNGILPSTPANGTTIKLSVKIGGANRLVKVADGSADTICGASKPCAIGVTEEGLAVAAETYIFMYQDGNWFVI